LNIEQCTLNVHHWRVCAIVNDFIQERHKAPHPLDRPRELVLACPPLKSNVNLSRIVRAAGCCGITRVIGCGNARILPEIARDAGGGDGGGGVEVELHRTLPPVIRRLRQDGYPIIGLEQTSSSQSIYDFSFPQKMVLVVGNERLGIKDELLRMIDKTVEIPVYGLPFSHNVATATAMALYEYCRQWPRG
jgi:tRNA G18 (ribose-2'-O)-methylase SpoU